MRRSVRIDLPPDQREDGVARRVARSLLECDGVGADGVDDAVLLTSELFINAVHATSDESDISVSVVLQDHDVLVSVSNHGQEFAPDERHRDSTETGGRGLEIARGLGATDVRHHNGTTTVSVDIPIEPMGDTMQPNQLPPKEDG
jgi:anti-sigma regulatory factor (Ser/Thr protein kinase)